MTPHHQGEIDMARVERQYGKDSDLRQLATDIVVAHGDCRNDGMARQDRQVV